MAKAKLGSLNVAKCYLGDTEVDASMLGALAACDKSGGTAPSTKKVKIRYTSSDDLSGLTAYAIGGTPEIVDNGDGTYDLQSDDPCTFIAIGNDYSDFYEKNITKIEVIEGSTLEKFYDDTNDDTSTFANIENVTEIIVDNKLSSIKSCLSMFNGCINLVKIDLSKLDTSKATSMVSMFKGCKKLANINFSNFDTSKTISMSSMLAGCEKLVSVDIAHFDTRNVEKLNSMFSGCKLLTTLDISNFETPKLNKIDSMFKGCLNIVSINIDSSKFHTSSVPNFSSMFQGCAKLNSVDISGFDTSSASLFNKMFYGTGFKTLDISHFNTTKANNISSMFENCSLLTHIDLRSFDFSSIIGMSSVFAGDSALTCITNIDTHSIAGVKKNMQDLFKDCTSLINPTATEIAKITAVNGFNYTNSNPCP